MPPRRVGTRVAFPPCQHHPALQRFEAGLPVFAEALVQRAEPIDRVSDATDPPAVRRRKPFALLEHDATAVLDWTRRRRISTVNQHVENDDPDERDQKEGRKRRKRKTPASRGAS